MAGSVLRPGDVILLFDGTIDPPKHKRFVCVVAAEGWFLRINSRRHFRPHCPVMARENPGCLDHDSFIELRGIIDYDLAEVAQALEASDARILGRLGAKAAESLVKAVRDAPTFTATEVTMIVGALESAYAVE